MAETAEKLADQVNREAEFPVQAENWEGKTAAERLKAAMATAGGPKAVAEKSRVPLSTIGGYTRGGEIKLSNLVQLAEASGVTVEWLATGRGPMRPGAAPAAAPPLPANPQESAPQAPRALFASVDMDRLALAYASAMAALAANGHYSPEPRRVMQVTTLIYDQLTTSEKPSSEPSK